MPIWENYYFNDPNINTAGTGEWVTVNVQHTWEECLQERSQEMRKMEQELAEMMEFEEERRKLKKEKEEDMKKYPLFFWREVCAKQRDTEVCKEI